MQCRASCGPRSAGVSPALTTYYTEDDRTSRGLARSSGCSWRREGQGEHRPHQSRQHKCANDIQVDDQSGASLRAVDYVDDSKVRTFQMR